jgi:hypothetical protein
MTTGASSGGFTLYRGDGGSSEVYHPIGEIIELDDIGFSLGLIDVTSFDSGGIREYIPMVFRDGNIVTVLCNFVLLDPQQLALLQDVQNKAIRNFKLRVTDGRSAYVYLLRAWMIGWKIEPSLTDRNLLRITFKIDTLEAPAITYPEPGGNPSSSGLPYVLAMHMDGSNGSTTFTDLVGATPEVTPGAVISTAQSTFGGASGWFPGPAEGNTLVNGLDARPLVRFPDIAGYRFASDITKDFTISLWLRMNDASKAQAFVSNAYFGNLGSGNGGMRLYLLASGQLRFEVIGGSSDVLCQITSNSTLSADAWYHVAVTGYYDGSQRVTRLFLGGLMVALLPAFQTANAASCGMKLHLGCARLSGTSNFLHYVADCYMDDLYILNGVTQWTDNFTPPPQPFTYP